MEQQQSLPTLTVEVRREIVELYEVEGTPERLAEIKALIDGGSYIATANGETLTLEPGEPPYTVLAELTYNNTYDNGNPTLSAPEIVEPETEEVPHG